MKYSLCLQVWFGSLILFLSLECSPSFGTSSHDTIGRCPGSAKLLDLAEQRFHNVSAAEGKLMEAAVDGTDADCTAPSDEDRVIRAELLAWLCVDLDVSKQVTSRGVSISKATIRGKLNLERATIPFPLRIVDTVFENSVNLDDTHLLYLSLSGTHVPGLSLAGAEIERSVYLNNGFESKSAANLSGTKIGGDLDCAGGNFLGAVNQPALSANGADIKGAVFMNTGFTAQGGVYFQAATIGSHLECTGGKFVGSAEFVALDAAAAKIRGFVFLNSDFSAEGGVTFASATIGRDLDCQGGRLASTGDGAAFDAQSAKIDGSVHFDSGTSAVGNVEFNFATITSAFFQSRDFQWTPVKLGEHALLDLRHAKAGSILMQLNKSPSPGDISIDGFVYDDIDALSSANSANPLLWIGRQTHDRFFPQPYEQLAAVLRKMGFQEDAVKVMIAKNEKAGDFALTEALNAIGKDWSKGRPLKAFGDLLTGIWNICWYKLFGTFIGYGYTPWNALFASLVIVVIGYCVFKRGYEAKIIIPKDDDVSWRQLFETYPKFNACIYSLEMFVPLVKLGVGDYWIPNAHGGAALRIGKNGLLKFGSLLRFYFWFHIIAGWVLTTLWVGGFTGLIKS